MPKLHTPATNPEPAEGVNTMRFNPGLRVQAGRLEVHTIPGLAYLDTNEGHRTLG